MRPGDRDFRPELIVSPSCARPSCDRWWLGKEEGGEQPAQLAEQVALPGNTWLAGEHAEQQAAVCQEQHDAHDYLAGAAADEPAHHQVLSQPKISTEAPMVTVFDGATSQTPDRPKPR